MARCAAWAALILGPSFLVPRRSLLVPLPPPDVRSMAAAAVERDPEAAPAFLRLAFHDAATRRGDGQGPNGSIRFELMRNENVGPSLRRALLAVEQMVKAFGVSWADAIALSGAVVVEVLGGPRIEVPLGRVDAMAPDAEGRLPEGGLTAGALRDYYRQLELTDEELVALQGAHTIGRWTSLLGVDGECMAKQGFDFWSCSREQGKRLPFTSRPKVFNNDYFKELLTYEQRQKKPPPRKRFKDRVNEDVPALYLIPSDIGLLYDQRLHREVEKFAADEAAFFRAFERAYLKLVDPRVS